MSRRAVVIFVALGCAWGIPYLLIKVAVEELTPAELVLWRTLIASVLLLPIAIGQGAVRPLLQRWRWLLAFAVLEIAIPWIALGKAEQTLPSSTTGLLIAAVPLVGVALSFATGQAVRLGWSGWLGIGLGIAGVAALVGLDLRVTQLSAVGELAITVVGYAIGPAILARRLAHLPPVGVISTSLAFTSLMYLPIVLVADGIPSQLPSGDVVLAVVVLAVVCTAAAFLLLFALVAEVGPVRATTITYVNPAVAVVAGTVVLDEQVTSWTGVGFVLVVFGSYLVNRRPRTESRRV